MKKVIFILILFIIFFVIPSITLYCSSGTKAVLLYNGIVVGIVLLAIFLLLLQTWAEGD